MRMRPITALSILGAVAVTAAGAASYGAFRWRERTRLRRGRLDLVRLPHDVGTYDERELEGLPANVQRYFRTVLVTGQPIVTGASLTQEGLFQSGPGKGWSPFQATQVITTRPPGFDWDARIRMAPGVNVLVHDSYVGGLGMLHASLLGLMTVADLEGTPELAQGELLRYLAEAVWLPTALLPSQGVRWEAMEGPRARATLEDGVASASLEIGFGEDGLIETVFAPSRHRSVDGAFQKTPWQGRFGSYARRGGMLVPLQGEVAWLLPEGPLPYWRGRLTEIVHELARSPATP